MDNNSENRAKLLDAASEKVRSNVAQAIELYNKIKWNKVSFIVPTTPKPSHRPRLSGYRIYVPGAAKNQMFFHKHVLPTLNGLFIDTPCKVSIDIYIPTPKSFTKTQEILAEMKLLRPWTNTGDVDNFCKSCLDFMQGNSKRGTVGLMENDCLVIDSDEHKYYSQTPRYEITISFMGKIPVQLRKLLRLKDVDGLV